MKRNRISTFLGGIHPTDGSDKQLSKDKTILKYIPDIVEISMEQSYGGFCEPVVKAGEKVKKGQLIGTPVTFQASNIHSSVDGTVEEIREDIHDSGKKETLCVIRVEKSDRADENWEFTRSIVPIDKFEQKDIIAKIGEGGLIGMGGGGFPSKIKYDTDKEIQTLLINGVECEPYLTCDYRLMLEQGFAIVNGVRLLMRASKAKIAYICVEDNKIDAAEKLSEIIKECDEDIHVKIVPTKYPQGGERQLIQTVLGVEVPKGRLPADVGAIVSNVASAKAAADILLGEMPVVSRVVTVSGAVKEPRNFLVPLGTKLDELILLAGGMTVEDNQVILGGPMTGTCIATRYKAGDKLSSVTKTTSGILVLEGRNYVETPCIRCGACRQICPAGLSPFQIDFAMIRKNYDLCEALYASECIACGSCSYICPARRELTYRTVSARNIVRQNNRERERKSHGNQ